MATPTVVPTQLCSHPSHAAWWATSPELPVTDFYHRSSKCKKCYIRQQQESKTRRITPSNTPSTPGMGPPSPLGNSLPLGVDATASPIIAKAPYPTSPAPTATRLGPVPLATPRPVPNAAINFNMTPPAMRPFAPMPTFSSPAPPPHHHFPAQPFPSPQSFPSLPLPAAPNAPQPYYAAQQPQPQPAATTPFILSRPPREVNRKALAAAILKRCKPVLDSIRASENAWPFNQPVDAVALELEDYNEIIKKPMDLRTVDDNLVNGRYGTETQFYDDVKLVWDNAKTYNKIDSEIYDFAVELSEIFETNYKRIVKECEMQAKTEADKEVRSDICAFCGFGVVIPAHQRPQQPPPASPALPLQPQKVQTQTQQITFQPSPAPPPSLPLPSSGPTSPPLTSSVSSPPLSSSSSSFPSLQVPQPNSPIPPPALPLPSSLASIAVAPPPPLPSVASPTEGIVPTPVEPKTEETSASPPLAPPNSPPITTAPLSQPPNSPPLSLPLSSSSSLAPPNSPPIPSSLPLRPPPPTIPTAPLTAKPLPLSLSSSATLPPPLTSSASLPSLPTTPSSSSSLPSLPSSSSALSLSASLAQFPAKQAAQIPTPLLHCDGACLRAFHAHCLNLAEYSTPWLCNECRTGKPVLHWDPAKSEYFYYYYDTTDLPPPSEDEYIENRSIGGLPREAKRKIRDDEEEYRMRGEMYFDDMWCMWRCRSRESVQQRDERQRHTLKKVSNGPDR